MPRQITIWTLHRVAREASRCASARLFDLALTFEDVLVLGAIAKKGRDGQTAVALEADLDYPAVRDIVRELVRRGLVTRLRRGALDARALRLTGIGGAILEQAERIVDQAQEHFRPDMSSQRYWNIANDVPEILTLLPSEVRSS